MRHELLAPAGSPDICRAVIAAGADAVYLGGEKYGARAFAQNFSTQEILSALDYAHLHGRKIFLTVNTLLKNRESGTELYEYLKALYGHGLDAIIVQDFGVFQFVREYFPELSVHASTQMSVSNVYGASFLQQCGASRIVTAWELSLGEIRRIHEQTGMEIESFVHGALCYCYSGQCLMSSLLGGRSGNRGRCAQPCRLPYQVTDGTGACLHKKEKFPLSLKDLCALDRIPQMCEAGVFSFKIEGRMKSLEYAAGVTQIYRKYLDLYESSPDQFRVENEDYRYLLALGNRNGFTRGYYEMRNGRPMVTLTDSSHASGDAKDFYRPVTEDKIPIAGKITIRQGEPLVLSVRTILNATNDSKDTSVGSNRVIPCVPDTMRTPENDVERYTVTVRGEMVSEAKKQPLVLKEVRERMCKTGDTSFVFSSLDVDLGESCFVPVRQLNEIRRNALCQLEQHMLHSYDRTAVSLKKYTGASGDKMAAGKQTDANRHNILNVQVSSPEQMEEALRHPFVTMISLDFHFMTSVEELMEILDSARRQIAASGKQAGFCFPFVFRENSSVYYESEEIQDVIRSFDIVWVRSYDSLGFCLQTLRLRPEQIALDYPLYICSEEAYKAFSDSPGDMGINMDKTGFRQYTASPELNKKELAHMPNGRAQFCLYGYQPLMISAQCIYKNYRQCTKNGGSGAALYLADRYHKKFSVSNDCFNCYNIIYNSMPAYLFHQADAVKTLGFSSYRISFVTEGAERVRQVLEDYRQSFPEGNPVSPPDRDSFTTGHFQRGVE
ncbi:MAG: U32 family peptidase [Clostridiales bacterium]|nr:U32 family peptidase [Clostridiales bacterium]